MIFHWETPFYRLPAMIFFYFFSQVKSDDNSEASGEGSASAFIENTGVLEDVRCAIVNDLNCAYKGL
jgi:hypothetical protein